MGGNTLPELFVMESLTLRDEVNNRLEGKIISESLRFHKKKVKYFYFRTKKEMKELLLEFQKSNYRYLHLSCHGNHKFMNTTFDANISFAELAEMTRAHLANRRFFVSACSMVNLSFGKMVLPGSGCNSIMGPTVDIPFADAVAFWPTFYHLMFKLTREKMVRDEILKCISKLAPIFEIQFGYLWQDNIGSLSHRDGKVNYKIIGKNKEE